MLFRSGAPLEDCLARKSTAHINIDECVTGAYHRSSLEGLALGCVVLNNCDWQCDQLIRQMTGGVRHPFITCKIGDLRAILQCLIAKGPGKLASIGERMRSWIEYAWSPEELIQRNYKPLMDAAVKHATLRPK